MNREELLRNREWWIANIQNDLYAQIHDYMRKNNVNQNGVAEKLHFSKSYLSQVLKGNFDHKISKLVDMALALDKAPLIRYIDLDEYVKKDKERQDYLTVQSIPPAKNNDFHRMPVSYDKAVRSTNSFTLAANES
jgi:predicted XRE-type DNA-binding protein